MRFLTIYYLALDSLLVRVFASQQSLSRQYHRSFAQHAANYDLDERDLDLADQSNESSFKILAASNWDESTSNEDEENDELDAAFLDYAAALLEKTKGVKHKTRGRRREAAFKSHHRHHDGRTTDHSKGISHFSDGPLVDLQSSSSEGLPMSCAGHFTPFSECQRSCYRWREYIIDSQAHDGGDPCIHPDHFVERQPCVGGSCKHEELPPTGDLPNEEKPATHIHHLALDVALPFASAIVLSMCIGEVVHHVEWLRAIPHSLVTILVAGSMGFLLRAHEDRFGADTFSPVCTGVMNLILLPIIIFQAGWSMRHVDFANNFLYICIFAVFGTAVSTLIIGSMVWITGAWQWHVITGAREAFAIAALISATDPVATLSAFALKKVEPRLNIIVLGESTINDAVAIALFNMLNIDEPTAYWFFPSAALRTFDLLFVSIGIGVVMGALLVMLLRAVKIVAKREDGHANAEHDTNFEVVFVLGSAYFINAVAECVHMSGIIACLFGGVTMGIYLRPHLSKSAEDHATYYIATASETADLTVFIMVGVTTALIKSSNGFRFGAILILFCIVGRAITVFICGGLCNVLHRARFGGELMDFLSVPKLVMLWHAGLRGGIALTLVLQLNDWCQHKAVLVTGTFIVIFALMVLMGSTIDAMLNLCKIETGCTVVNTEYKELHQSAQGVPGAGSWLHRRVLHPMLVGDAVVQKQQQGV